MDANMFNSIAQNANSYSDRIAQMGNTNITNHLNGMMNTQIGKQIHKTAEDQLNNLLGTSGAEVAGIAAHMAYRGMKYRGAVQQLRAAKAADDADLGKTSEGVSLSKEDQLTNVRNMLKKSQAGRQQIADTEYNQDPKNFPDNVGFEAAPPKETTAKFTSTVTKGIQTRGPGGEGIGGGGGDFDTSKYRYDVGRGRMISRETGQPVTESEIRQGSSDSKPPPQIDPEGDLPFGLTSQTRSMLDSISQSGSIADKVNLFSQNEPVFKPKPTPLKVASAAEPISTQTEENIDVFGNSLPVSQAVAPQGTYRRGGTSIGSSAYKVGTQPTQPTIAERPPTPARSQEGLEAPTIPEPTLSSTYAPPVNITPPTAAPIPLSIQKTSGGLAGGGGLPEIQSSAASQLRAAVPSIRSTATDSEPLISGGGGYLSRGLGGALSAAGAGIQGGKNLGKNLAFAGGQTALDEIAPGAGSLLSMGQTLGDKALSGGAKARSIATGAGTLAGVEGAEALLPGAGEILMGLTAVGGLIADLVEKGQEKAPAPPQMPQTQQLSFDDARPLDSSQYRGPIGGLQQ